jgi:TolB-like protein/Tfp pilus assembly protein PilF
MKPSIAVLPFNNMSGDPEQEFFSDGITEDIITELSRFRDLHVVARNSSFTFKGKVVSIPEVGRELNVAYVLEGSVRRAGNRVRVTAQLIDAETGNHVWADRYDREVSDVFEVQDEITRKIVGMLTVGLEDDALERARRKHPENLAAYEHWLRGKRLLWTTGEHNIASRAHFAKAADLDPGFSRAHSGLAVTYQMEAVECLIPDEAAKARDNSYNSAMKAIQLDEADYQAHIALAWPLLYRRDYDRMKKHIDRAIQLNPNDADTLANAAYPLAMYGDAEAAVACGKAAIALNPRHPDWYMAFLATALFTARRLDEALEARRKASAVFVDSIFFYAALLGHLGHVEDARKLGEVAVSRLRSTPIGQQIAEAGCIEFMLQNNPYRLMSDREFFAEGMRMAGVPG